MNETDAQQLRFPVDLGCFGCSPTNPLGLKASFLRRGDRVVADYTVADAYHGAPGVVHGGIVATLLDEVSCVAALFVGGVHVVTGELTVRYEAPVPVEAPIQLESWITSATHPRYLVIEATVSRAGVRLARSTGKFFRTPLTFDAP
ncbi:MAG: PaaI family thioesterase [Candidatus Binatia bacterium]